MPTFRILLLVAALALPWIARGEGCADCTADRVELQKQEAALKTNEDLMARNRAYLANLDPREASKSIKVKSNILILSVRLETIKNNMTGARNQLAAKGCDQCPIAQ